MIVKSTGLKFYETIPEQDWTYRDIEKHSDNVLILGDHWGIIPFQIITDTLIGLVTECDLIEQTGDVIDLLDEDSYDIIRHITIENDASLYWIIFDGIVEQEIDDGVYYIKLGDGIQTFYSEYFKIIGKLDYEPSAMERPVRSLTYYTNERGGPEEILKPNGTYGPMMYYYNNKSYGCWLQRGGVGYSCESMVYAIYHKLCRITESYGVGPGTLNATDEHAVPTVVVADDGHIVIAHERLTGVGDPNHNGFMQIKRSDNPEDETSWINAIAHNPGYFDEKGNEAANRLSYNSLDKLANGKLFLFCRHSSAGELNRVSVHRSNDHGVSWNDLGGNIDGGCDVVDLRPTVTGSDLVYKALCKHPYNNSLHLMVRWYDDPVNSPDLYYLESHDNGVTWQDVSGGFTQDITIAGNNPITKANLDAGGNDFLVKNCIAPENIAMIDGIITDAGIPYIVAYKGSAGVYDAFMYYWNGAAWVETDMGLASNTTVGCVLFQRENNIEMIFADAQNGTFKRSIFRSRSLTDMNDWTLIREIYEDDKETYEMNRSLATFNYMVADYETFAAMINRDIDFYSDFFLYTEMDAPCCMEVIELEWWNENDFCDVIYQTGYKNRLFLDAIMSKPENVIFEDSQEDEEKNIFPIIQTQRKYFNFETAGSEAMFDMLGTLRIHDYIYITFKDGTKQRVFDIKVETTWQNENLCLFKLSFFTVNCTTAGCEDNFVLQENLILNGDFSAWTGDNPDDWTVVGEVGADPEVCQVAPNQGHAACGGAGVGACNIYTTLNNVYIRQNILTIGKIYLIEIEITEAIAGSITVIMGSTGNTTVLSTEGIHRFVRICDGTDGQFFISTINADITIDNVSVIQLD